ncbi:N-acetyltransferase ESCO1 [Porphyridium purpureum]|uniref:N-acetyltransferase ESCO1 n=1 Tax=Porphyridium purpureum TaxID=35688 RepID=A0A5J4Z7E6_PORPP|nr:N-acetyltransferase ESCO1 [Porphyridium purpureum]|eukprot:POR4327..scf295_1
MRTFGMVCARKRVYLFDDEGGGDDGSDRTREGEEMRGLSGAQEKRRQDGGLSHCRREQSNGEPGRELREVCAECVRDGQQPIGPPANAASDGGSCEAKDMSQVDHMEKSERSKRKRTLEKDSTLQARPRRLVQLYLDVGQKAFGGAECAECGMVYNQGERNDEREHSLFHRQALLHKQLQLDDRLIGALSVPPTLHQHHQLESSARILLVPGAERLRKSIVDVLERIDSRVAEDMGAMMLLRKLQARRSDAMLFASIGKCRRVQAIVLVERIERSTRVRVESLCSDSSATAPVAFARAQIPSVETQPAVCGFYCVWVPASHRRQGLASELLSVALLEFGRRVLPGRSAMLRREECAFSAPTSQGLALARSFFGPTSNYIYTYSLQGVTELSGM